jgi:hypothetical protein
LPLVRLAGRHRLSKQQAIGMLAGLCDQIEKLLDLGIQDRVCRRRLHQS